jgi:hypothetical protein
MRPIDIVFPRSLKDESDSIFINERFFIKLRKKYPDFILIDSRFKNKMLLSN